MPTVGTQLTTRNYPYLAVPLARYVAMVQAPECQFWGVRNEDEWEDQCREIWTLKERNHVAYYLWEAQLEIEKRLGYLAFPRHTSGTIGSQTEDQLLDRQAWMPKVIAKWGKVRALGCRATTVIDAAAALDMTADPALVGPLAVDTAATEGEIFFYHPVTGAPIHQSAITVSGGFVSAEIPRCRLVLDPNNPKDGLDYTDDANFLTTITVKREYTDTSVNLIYELDSGCCSGITTEESCARLDNWEIGSILLRRSQVCGGCRPIRVRLCYLSGLDPIDERCEMAIVRLAHAKMPEMPCGCDITKAMWASDRRIPDETEMTAARLQCPFGLSEGAWHAWVFASDIRLMRSFSL